MALLENLAMKTDLKKNQPEACDRFRTKEEQDARKKSA
jgi:hypothetical protein